MSLIKEAEDLFGNMRDTTPEEQKCIDNHIKNISVPTGVNIFDLLDSNEEAEKTLKLKEMNKDNDTNQRTSNYRTS